jgi:lipid A 4'-phosphatase
MTSPLTWAAGLALAILTFCLWPGLDLWVSGLFFDGTGFPVYASTVVEAFRRSFYAAEDLAGVLAVAMAVWTSRAGPKLGQGARTWAFQGLVFLLGPALLVNGILKPLWSRPRPYLMSVFGGPDAFQPIWALHGTCPRNCSFTSGEMAGATALTLMALMLARANRAALGPRLYGLVLAVAVLPLPFTAWQRIAAGRHFLSDVVLSALAVGLIASLLARLMRPRG